MFNKTSIGVVLVLALVVVGVVPLVAAAAAGVAVGAVVFAIVGAIVSFWLFTVVITPLRNLANAAKSIETAVRGEMNFPELDALKAGAGQEMATIAAGLQGATSAFQKRLAELNSIHAISQTITSSTLDYEKTVKSVLAAVQRVVDYDAAEVAVLRGANLTVEAWWGKDGFKDTTGRKYRVGKGPTGTIAETKAPVFMSTVQATEDLQRTIGYASVENEFIAKTTKLIINSFLGIPLLIGDRLIGTLSLVHHQAAFFSEDDKRQLNKLADHASIAIDNALQVREREEALRRQIQELRIEIDQSKLTTQVQEVVDTDYFRQLQASAAKMRERHSRPEKSGGEAAESMDDTMESRKNQTSELGQITDSSGSDSGEAEATSTDSSET